MSFFGVWRWFRISVSRSILHHRHHHHHHHRRRRRRRRHNSNNNNDENHDSNDHNHNDNADTNDNDNNENNDNRDNTDNTDDNDSNNDNNDNMDNNNHNSNNDDNNDNTDNNNNINNNSNMKDTNSNKVIMINNNNSNAIVNVIMVFRFFFVGTQKYPSCEVIDHAVTLIGYGEDQDCEELCMARSGTSMLTLHPGRLTWNIIIEVWKIIFLSKWVICMFHVNLPGCSNKKSLNVSL